MRGGSQCGVRVNAAVLSQSPQAATDLVRSSQGEKRIWQSAENRQQAKGSGRSLVALKVCSGFNFKFSEIAK